MHTLALWEALDTRRDKIVRESFGQNLLTFISLSGCTKGPHYTFFRDGVSSTTDYEFRPFIACAYTIECARAHMHLYPTYDVASYLMMKHINIIKQNISDSCISSFGV